MPKTYIHKSSAQRVSVDSKRVKIVKLIICINSFFSAHSSVETFGQKSGAKRGVQENRSSNQVIY